MLKFGKKNTPSENNSEFNQENQTPLAPADTPTVQIIDARPNLYIDTAFACHLGTRQYQQDAAYASEPLTEPGTVFAILCDGMGGMKDGDLASADTVEFFANHLAALNEQDNIAQSYSVFIDKANQMIHKRYLDQGREVGTTLVSTYIQNNHLYWASVGDSRIYLLRDGEIARLTKDHNYALRLQDMVNIGKISQEEADNDPRKEALLSYIGAPVLEVIDISRSPFILVPDDIILLCSDGLTKILSDEQILSLLNPPPNNLSEAIHRLITATIDGNNGAQDNTSIVLIHYLGS